MKTVKILLASLIISASAFSQTTKTPEERAKHQTEKMKTELGLTADQEQKVYNINLGIDQKNEGVKTSTMTEEEKRKGLKYNNEARETMLKEVLTADQFTKFQALKQEKIEMRKDKKAQINKANIQKANETKTN